VQNILLRSIFIKFYLVHMYYVIYKVLFCLQISFVLKTWKYIINVLFFHKKHNFKNTTQKYITSSGEYSAVLHVTKKKNVISRK